MKLLTTLDLARMNEQRVRAYRKKLYRSMSIMRCKCCGLPIWEIDGLTEIAVNVNGKVVKIYDRAWYELLTDTLTLTNRRLAVLTTP